MSACARRKPEGPKVLSVSLLQARLKGAEQRRNMSIVSNSTASTLNPEP